MARFPRDLLRTDVLLLFTVLFFFGAISPAQKSPARAAARPQMSDKDLSALHGALDAYDQGKNAEAEPALRHLLEKYPHNYEANEALGSLYVEAGDTERAIPYLEQACRVAPAQALAHANLGAAYLKSGSQGEAIKELQRAIALEPSNAQTQSNLGQAYMLASQPKLAVKPLSVAAHLTPADSNVKYNLALALFQSGAAAEAGDVLNSLPAEAMSEQAHSLAADADEHAGRFEKALTHYQAAAQLNPSDQNLYALTIELLRHWTWPEAIKVAAYGASRYPASTHFRMAEGIGYYASGQYQQAVGIFSKLLQEDHNNAAVADLLGRNCSLVADGVNADCSEMYEYAAQHPGNAIIATYAAIAVLHQPGEQQDLDKAASLLASAMKSDPAYAEAYLQMGILEQTRLHWTESVGYLEKAIALRPKSAESHYRLSRAYAHLGRRDEARAEVALHQAYSQQSKEAVDARMQEVMKFVLSPS